MTKSRFTLNFQTMKPRSELIADAIRTSILRGYFEPGDKLDQQEIAEELAVSHTPVREALRTLDAEGIVTIIANKGAVVTEYSVAELSEIYFIRSILEGTAAARSVGQMAEARTAKMQSILEAAEQTNELDQLLALNNEFHMLVYGAIHQPMLMDLIQRLRNKVGPYNRMYLDLAGRNKADAWADHRRIYEACLAKDAQQAKFETQHHLDRVLEILVSAMADAQE